MKKAYAEAWLTSKSFKETGDGMWIKHTSEGKLVSTAYSVNNRSLTSYYYDQYGRRQWKKERSFLLSEYAINSNNKLIRVKP